jgi:hypothetical protein
VTETATEAPSIPVRGGDPAIAAVIHLLVLTIDRSWTMDSAATELRKRVPERSVLHRTRDNLSKMLADSSSWIIERSAAILDRALSVPDPDGPLVDHAASCGWVFDGPCPRCSGDG